MLEFLINNLGTIAVALIVGLMLIFIALKIIKDKKSGKSSCGCGCSSCPYSGRCHGVEETSDT